MLFYDVFSLSYVALELFIPELFIDLQEEMDPEILPGTLRKRWEYTLDETLVTYALSYYGLD